MLSEERKIKTRAQLREYLEADCARYPMSARRILPYLLQISEGAILRRHIVLLRKTEYYTNTGRRLLAAFYHARLMKFQNRYCLHVPVNCAGKGLWIGIGSLLVGGIRIADGVNIGAGAVVTRDFLEPGVTIAGVPAKKLGGPKPPENGGQSDAP